MLTIHDLIAFAAEMDDEEFEEFATREGLSDLDAVEVAAQTAASAPRTYRVLVVEDDPAATRLMDHTVHSIGPGFEVHAVSSVEAAIHLLSEGPYSMVISDYSLDGDPTGIDLYDYCQRNYPQMPFLLVSGLVSAVETELNHSRHPHPPFLQKPYKPAQCRNMVEFILEGEGAYAHAG